MIIKLSTHYSTSYEVNHFNDFDISSFKRIYFVSPKNCKQIIGWNIHKIESKLFNCIEGEFEVRVVDLKTNEMHIFNISSKKGEMILIPSNHANAFKALSNNSKIQILSDKSLSESNNDGKIVPIGYFGDKWE